MHHYYYGFIETVTIWHEKLEAGSTVQCTYLMYRWWAFSNWSSGLGPVLISHSVLTEGLPAAAPFNIGIGYVSCFLQSCLKFLIKVDRMVYYST